MELRDWVIMWLIFRLDVQVSDFPILLSSISTKTERPQVIDERPRFRESTPRVQSTHKISKQKVYLLVQASKSAVRSSSNLH